MNDSTRASIAATVPFAVTRPDRVDARRYYDPEFYRLEQEKLWPHVWQMACRLQEIEKPGDFVVYEIFDQSVIVVRVDEKTVKAYHNHCRHRGVKLAQDRGCAKDGFTCPFHGWQWRADGQCKFIYTPEIFEKDQLRGSDLALRECRLETWGGCAFINFDDDAPCLRESIGPFADIHDAWHVESLKVEWWYAARLPVNWKLAMEAFMEGYHVLATHPQLVPGDPTKPETIAYVPLPPELSPMSPYQTLPTAPMPATIPSKDFIGMNLYFMKMLNEGMAGMTHLKDIQTAEALVETQLPEDFVGATVEWRKKLNDAVVEDHRKQGMDIGDLNDIDARRYATAVNYLLPALLPAADVRQRLVVSDSSPRTGGVPVRAVVPDAVSGRRDSATNQDARAVGVQRPALAADPDAGFLEPAAAATGPAHERFRVHAAVKPGRGAHQQLPAADRRLPGRGREREAAGGRAAGLGLHRRPVQGSWVLIRMRRAARLQPDAVS